MRKLHFIGIGGIGMSSLATIALQRGWSVSGSDFKDTELVAQMRAAGATISLGHDAKNVPPQCEVVVSTAVAESNPELQAARSAACPILHRSELLAGFTREASTYAVAGTHGKTSTSSLLAHVLDHAGWTPSFSIGGIVDSLGGNGRWCPEAPFVIEADESDGTLVCYRPQGAIITNVDHEHIDHYRSIDKLVYTVELFASQVESQRLLVVCGDDPRLTAVAQSGITYGFSQHCDVSIVSWRQQGWRSHLMLQAHGSVLPVFELPLIGKHQALNASAVIALCLGLDLPIERLREGLKSFQGVRRRCQVVGQAGDLTIVDDYAHHPTEIGVTLAAIRTAVGNERVTVVFQPHRYSRTQACLSEMEAAFVDADQVFVTEIYGAGESPIPGVDHDAVVAEIGARARHIPRCQLMQRLPTYTEGRGVVLFVGAGDITGAAHELASLAAATC